MSGSYLRRLARPVVHVARGMAQAVDRVLRPPVRWNGEHHEVLLRFPPWEGHSDGRFTHDFVGVRTDPRFRPQFRADAPGPARTLYPAPHAGYFEWIFVLDSLLAPHRDAEFTMVELGAGYGHWIVAAHVAARRLGGPRMRLVGVEMVPQHFEWMAEHLRNNDIDPDEHTLIHGAVSDRAGRAVYREEADRRFDFGQTLRRRFSPEEGSVGGGVEVPCIALGELLDTLPVVDLLHVDIQGEELRALASVAERLRSRVRRLIVATHSRAIHRELQALFDGGPWVRNYDFGFRRRERTEFGDVQFLDGLLACTNRDL